jgi:hypothetical protein
MIWYILNIPDTITSQDVVITSGWYIQKILGICWFGIVLAHRPRPYNVLAMYWVSTSPLAPSDRHSFVVVDAFPVIPKTARGDGMLGLSDELFWNDVGGREKPHPTA